MRPPKIYGPKQKTAAWASGGLVFSRSAEAHPRFHFIDTLLRRQIYGLTLGMSFVDFLLDHPALEGGIIRDEFGGPWGIDSGLDAKEISDLFDDGFVVVPMMINILTGNIGQGPLQVVRVSFKDQKLLLMRTFNTASAISKIDAKLKRHVHPEKLTRLICAAPRQIMNRISRSLYKIDNLVESVFTRFQPFTRQTWIEAKINDTEHRSLQKRFILDVEGTVDENVPMKIRIHEIYFFAGIESFA